MQKVKACLEKLEKKDIYENKDCYLVRLGRHEMDDQEKFFIVVKYNSFFQAATSDTSDFDPTSRWITHWKVISLKKFSFF